DASADYPAVMIGQKYFVLRVRTAFVTAVRARGDGHVEVIVPIIAPVRNDVPAVHVDVRELHVVRLAPDRNAKGASGCVSLQKGGGVGIHRIDEDLHLQLVAREGEPAVLERRAALDGERAESAV